MSKRGKNYVKAKEVKGTEVRDYTVEEAVGLLKKAHYAKFDESVDVSIRLGVNPKYSDQMVRGTIVLPHGTGKTKKICVIATGEKIKEAEEAGADYAGGDDIIEKIAGGWIDFDVVIATPDVMRRCTACRIRSGDRPDCRRRGGRSRSRATRTHASAVQAPAPNRRSGR